MPHFFNLFSMIEGFLPKKITIVENSLAACSHKPQKIANPQNESDTGAAKREVWKGYSHPTFFPTGAIHKSKNWGLVPVV